MSSQSPPNSPKRAHSGESLDDRPPKQLKLSPEPEITGLEETGILDNISSKQGASLATKIDSETYARRAKTSSYARSIREKRLMARQVRSRGVKMPNAGQQGMKNLSGSLCYRHSLFQAIVHSPKVGYWLCKFHSEEMCVWDEPGSCVACGLRDVFRAYWSGSSPAMTTALEDIDKVFKNNAWTAGILNGQADPEEQFTWIIGIMFDQLPKRAYSFFEAVHRFVLEATTHCNKCGNVSTNQNEVEGTISVPIQPRIADGDLSKYLQKYFHDHVFGFKCDKCKDDAKKYRPRQIAHSPDVVLIQLKRFSAMGRKDSFPVPFSTTLDLNSYRTPGNKSNSTYDLSAVISHSGSTGSGHYRCAAKGTDEFWNIFDDSRVIPVNEKQAINPGDGKGWTPYLLFFRRVPSKRNSR